MDTRVLKEPRGFMRILELLFAIIAFATCANFSTHSEYSVECTSGQKHNISYEISYPFKLDHQSPVNVTCNATDKTPYLTRLVYPPGDYSSDAQFFVFTGVISFLMCILSLVVYVMFSGKYTNDQKSGPLIDFFLTVIIAVFWLSASAAWANGVINMKFVAEPVHWIFEDSHLNNTVCSKSNDMSTYIITAIRNCTSLFEGKFTGANVSIILGFLNFFLWTSNLWFLYKETAWFAGRASGPPQGGQPLP